ncbi:hypothetical protein vBOeSunk162_29 [Oenococcus phage vB_OeS_unk162]|nr:hypothetical protein vBOeSunk162_29 [Oenococcus phage vB_OeS_unk162]
MPAHKIPDKYKKTIQIDMWVSPTEAKKMKENAMKNGYTTLSSFIRDVAQHSNHKIDEDWK